MISLGFPLIVLLGAGVSPPAPASASIAAEDVVFADVKKPGGAPAGFSASDLWGDSKTGAHGSLARFPAGFAEPPHRHTAETHVVIVRGEMIYTLDGKETAPLGPGSFVRIAAGAPHASRCTTAGGCEIFLEQAQAMDVKPVAP